MKYNILKLTGLLLLIIFNHALATTTHTTLQTAMETAMETAMQTGMETSMEMGIGMNTKMNNKMNTKMLSGFKSLNYLQKRGNKNQTQKSPPKVNQVINTPVQSKNESKTPLPSFKNVPLADVNFLQVNLDTKSLLKKAANTNATATGSTLANPTPAKCEEKPAPFLGGSKIKKETDGLDIKNTEGAFFQGWVKYFKWKNFDNDEAPKEFFKNTEFERQFIGMKPADKKALEDKKDAFGTMAIPSNKSFYMVVYYDDVNFMLGRGDMAMKSVWDNLKIDFIKAVPKDNPFIGGIKDYGSFSEGSCFTVETVVPKGDLFRINSEKKANPSQGLNFKWVICLEDDNKKIAAMSALAKIKLNKQNEVGISVGVSKGSNNNDAKRSEFAKMFSTNTDDLNPKNRESKDGQFNEKGQLIKDGYWVVIQDWTQCTLKCGGGRQYMQLMCIPPENGGLKCEGESIRTRICNTEACPNSDAVAAVLPKSPSGKAITVKTEKPIIKVMPISTKPERYDKCYLKDTDAIMMTNDSNSRNLDEMTPNGLNEDIQKVPIRLVMNNKTVSAFRDDELINNLITFELNNTEFQRVEGNPKCFILMSNNGRAQFCQITRDEKGWVEEWDYDFNLFKHQCAKKRPTLQAELNKTKELKVQFDKKITELKQEMVTTKQTEIKKKAEHQEEVELKTEIEEAQSSTLQAVQKEMKLEEMLTKEEENKEQEEIQQMEVAIENEKKKNNCLLKTIKEKQLEDQFNMKKSEAKKEIEKSKSEAKRLIIEKRNELKKKISMMKKKSSRKLAELKGQMMNVRTELAANVSKLSKSGDKKQCFDASRFTQNDKEYGDVEVYCASHFEENYTKLGDCRRPDSFCYVCCETEFGDSFVQKRDECYNTQCNNKTDESTDAVKAVSS